MGAVYESNLCRSLEIFKRHLRNKKNTSIVWIVGKTITVVVTLEDH